MIKKKITVIGIFLFIILCGIIFEDILLISQTQIVSTTSLPKKIDYNIPLIKQKIHIDISAKDRVCKEYINKNNIIMRIAQNGISINSFELNKLKYNETINIEILASKKLAPCNLFLEIIDPYGNMWKTLLTIILPFLLVLYLIITPIQIISAIQL